MWPRRAPIVVVPSRPGKVTERFLHLDPNAVVLVSALKVADLFFQFGSRFVEFGGVGVVRGGLRAPLRVGEAERDPARFVSRKIRGVDRAINLIGFGV
jgi:hypothetical protein